MDDIFGALILMCAFIGLYAFMFRGTTGRVGRPPRGFLTRGKSPTDAPLGLAAMGAYALGSAAGLTNEEAGGSTGLLIGLLVALVVVVPGVRQLSGPVFDVLGVTLALWAMISFALGDGDDLGTFYRVSLMALILACFVGAIFLFGRLSAFRGGRGLALLGLVDIVTFLASPSTQDSLSLSAVDHLTFLVVAGGIAFALGFLASEYVLGVVAFAVVSVSLLNEAVVGNANSAWVALVATLSAVGFVIAFKGATSLVRR